jgi:acyl-CoA synthetase (AMP-forming)/AMP-acid ligase II/acyl carrier protein
MAELAEGDLPPGLRTVNLAGEALRASLVERIYRHPQVQRVVNLYGPSEDTTYSTCAALPPGSGQGTFGRPVVNSRAHLLDRCLRPVPLGVQGELFLSGAGLARGYLDRPELTAERFVPDPFGEPGGRLYATGDLARWGVQGDIVYLGRLDHQIKIRGFRVELGEIEAALKRHAAVEAAVVLAREDGPGELRLVAYVVSRNGGAPKGEELRQFLRNLLPQHAVPTFFVLLAALPLSPNGKVDRRALPAPERPASQPFEPATTPLEAELADLWREVLRVERVGREDNFFDLGGHSLLIVKLRRRLEERFAREISMLEMFQHTTVSAMAAHLSGGKTAAKTEPTAHDDRDGELAQGKKRLAQRLRQHERRNA